MAAAKFQRSTENLVPKIAATKSALFKIAKKKTLQKGNQAWIGISNENGDIIFPYKFTMTEEFT